MKDERGTPVFSGPAIDALLTETIIEHAAQHARNEPREPASGAGKQTTEKGTPDYRAGAPNKKPVLKIVVLALMGIITVACFLMVGSFYFVKKSSSKKRK